MKKIVMFILLIVSSSVFSGWTLVSVTNGTILLGYGYRNNAYYFFELLDKKMTPFFTTIRTFNYGFTVRDW